MSYYTLSPLSVSSSWPSGRLQHYTITSTVTWLIEFATFKPDLFLSMSKQACLPSEWESWLAADVQYTLPPWRPSPTNTDQLKVMVLDLGGSLATSLKSLLYSWVLRVGWTPVVGLATVITVAALTTLVIWSVIYNIYFHPLAKYPGPFVAKITPLYHIFYTRQKNIHLILIRLHSEYGPIVRVAPDRICFESAKAYKDIYGQGANLQKSSGYAPHPYYPKKYNLNNVIDSNEFGKKKRLVLQAFTETVLRKFDIDLVELVNAYCDTLSNELVDMGTLSFCFGLDAVSIGIFGRSLDLLQDQSRRWILTALLEGNQYMYLRLVWPRFFNSWVAKAIRFSSILFPNMKNDGHKFDELCKEISDNGARKGALTAALLEAVDPKTKEVFSESEAWNEALLILRAAGDTTSTALSSFFFYITRNLDAYSALVNEIDSTFTSLDSIVPGPDLTSCQYLRAALDEAMRLGPPAPACFWREVRTGGATVDGTKIPCGYDVGVNLFGMQRNPKYHQNPMEYLPNRFLPPLYLQKTQTASHKAVQLSPPPLPQSGAFYPFQIGTRACPGKVLAYREMSIFVARIFFSYNVYAANSIGAGAPGLGYGRENPNEFQLYDVFSSDKRGPYIKFRPRKFQRQVMCNGVTMGG